jgi:hypothetical protein
VRHLSSAAAALAICLLGACGGSGSSPAPGATLAVVSGDGQSVQQHQPTAPLVARLTDASGAPVAGASVTFAPTADSERLGPTVAVTGADGTASWSSTFHTAGTQRMTASTPGAAAVTFTINIAATPYTFDGSYDCSFDGGPAGQMLIQSDQVVDDSSGHVLWSGAVDRATATFSGFYHPTLDIYNNMTGHLALDATQVQATASGTYTQGGPVGYGPGTWSCARLPVTVVTAPLAITPAQPTLTVGVTPVLVVRDAAGNPIAVTWQSSNPAVAELTSVPFAATSADTLNTLATGTTTIQVQDPITSAIASTTVTVTDAVDVSPWLGTWTGTFVAPTFLPGGEFDCGAQVSTPAKAVVEAAASGNAIWFTFLNASGSAGVVDTFLVPASGATAVTLNGSPDTLTLSGTTLHWVFGVTGCSTFSGTHD